MPKQKIVKRKQPVKLKPKSKKTTKRKAKTGRPRIQFDLKEIESLGKLHCTYEEMAGWLGHDEETIRDRMQNEPAFLGAYKKGAGQTKMSLRRKQLQAAMDGNITMMIWMGKQLLGQTDKSETVEISGTMSCREAADILKKLKSDK